MSGAAPLQHQSASTSIAQGFDGLQSHSTYSCKRVTSLICTLAYILVRCHTDVLKNKCCVVEERIVAVRVEWWRQRCLERSVCSSDEGWPNVNLRLRNG